MEQDFYRKMLENMYEGVYFVDTDRKITFWNKGAERITGFDACNLLGKHCHDNILNHVDDHGNQLCLDGCPLHKTIETGEMQEVTLYLHHKEGHRVPITARTVPLHEDGKLIGAVEVFTDDEEKVNLLRNITSFKELAMKDQLTELPNRRYLEHFMESKISEYAKLDIQFGVAFLDIDHFKKFNDDYGHDVGDEVLKMVAKTYDRAKRKTDMVGRWGGEEFIAIFVGVDEEGLKNAAEKIRMLIENSSLRAHDESLSVTISVGATMAVPDDTVESIIKRADDLMYKSKQNGRNKVTID